MNGPAASWPGAKTAVSSEGDARNRAATRERQRCSTNPTKTTTACRSTRTSRLSCRGRSVGFRHVSDDGIVNLAPYSQFNNLAYDPPYVMFSASSFPQSGRRKDSAKNAADTGEFVVNMATYELREAVNITSQFVPPDVDEAKLAGLK